MHTVQCPHCHRTFRIAKAVVNARMKCSGCGESFVGSSVESADQATQQVLASILDVIEQKQTESENEESDEQ